MPYEDSMFVPPWHVWSADFINNEEWNHYKDYEVFTHPGGHERLPVEISRKVRDWKRPNELFGTDGLMILPEGDVSNVQNLLTVNKSLMNVKAYRWMLYHIIIYIRRFKNKWPIPWHPTSNIYSRCKVTAAWNKKPKPVFNPFGKYWLKLYYMGEFRLICVSDHLPVGESGQVLLPLCENNKVLWLPLLIKGLLRIYALAGEFHQFNTITCLTGWTCVHEDCRGIPKDDVWSALMAHSPRPLSDCAKTVAKSESTTRKLKHAKVHYEDCYTVDNKGEKCFRGNDVSVYRTNPPNSIFTSIILSPNPFNEEGKRDPLLNRLEYDQPVLVNFTEMKKNEVIPSWKAIRWTDWALENKVVKHHEVHEFRRTINMFTPCSLILEKTCQLKDVLQEYEISTEVNRYEMDFTYLEQFVVSIEIYFKKNQAFPFAESIVFPGFKNTERNHCVYMQLESPYCESALFILTTCNNYVLEDGTMARNLSSSNYHNQMENPFIVVEPFYWPITHLSKPTSYICFKNSSKDIIKFKPGINVLKIWGELPDNYSLIVESTAPFTIIQTEEGAYESLTVQPKPLKTFVSNIQKAFNILVNAESHTGEHGQALIQFYSSFLSKSASLKSALEKAEICTSIRKHVLEAVLKWTENNCLRDFTAHVAVEVFKEFQEMFQERNLRSERITQLLETIRKEREELQRSVTLSAQPSKRSRIEDKSTIGAKKSQFSKNKIGGKSLPGSPGSIFKTIVVQGLHDNMLDIISDVLGQMGADEYPFEKHQINRTVLISQEVDVGKVSVNSLLLVVFKFELNTHSLTEPGLTLILVSNKDGTGNECSVNLDLFENGRLIQPINQNGNMYSVCRADNGYTLLGWVSRENGECWQNGYRVSFFGHANEVLHTCSARKVESIHRCAGTTCEKTELTSQHVVDVFLDLNPENVLARASLCIENAGSFSIYCRLSDVNATLELRVMRKNKDDSSMIAFARNIGDTVLLPLVDLDPIVILDDTEEDSFEKISFVIEVVLIEPNNDIVLDASPKPILGDWSIICVYDQKLTGVNLQVNHIEEYTYISSIPSQAVSKSQQPPASSRYNKPPRHVDLMGDNDTSATFSDSGLNHSDILKFMLIEQETMTRLIQDQDSKNFLTEEEQESILSETTYRQNVNEDLTKKIQDLNEENRKRVNDDVLTRVAKLFNIKPKSQINIKQSRVRKVKV